jgi:hypothetical protein
MQRDFCTAVESIHNTGHDTGPAWEWVPATAGQPLRPAANTLKNK